MSEGHAPAFVRPDDTCDENGNWQSSSPGLTKRELFAAMAMQGLAGNYGRFRSEGELAEAALNISDALIAALNGEETQLQEAVKCLQDLIDTETEQEARLACPALGPRIDAARYFVSKLSGGAS